MVVVDKERFRTVPASIALTRAYNALAQGDVSSVVKYAELALKLTPDEDHLGRCQCNRDPGARALGERRPGCGPESHGRLDRQYAEGGQYRFRRRLHLWPG